MSGYANHPYADIFPYAREEDFAALCQDIMLNGLIEPIVLYNGDVLDGRNRYRACINTRVEPRFTEFHGDDASALRFVISKNLARRHLDASQRAMAAARIANIKHGENQHTLEDGPIGPSTIKEASEKLNVGRSSVKRARKVLASDDAELISAVDAGEVTVSAAAEYLETPEAERPSVKSLSERAKAKGPRVITEEKKPAAAPASTDVDKLRIQIRNELAKDKSFRDEIRAEMYEDIIRDVKWKVRFAEQYHPAWGLPKIPLKQAEYNLLLRCLHPDMIARFGDDELSARFAEGLAIVKKLKLTISKPDDFRDQPKFNMPNSLEEYLANYNSRKRQRTKKPAKEKMQ